MATLRYIGSGNFSAGGQQAVNQENLRQARNAFGTSNSAEDAARRSFAESFGQMSQQTLSRNLSVQPTLEIRPGYRFNILVDQDIVFPSGYR